MATALAAPEAGLEGHYEGTCLNRTSIIDGNLFFEGAVRIDGKIDGEIVANGEVTIGETAVVTARIKASSVLISGKVNGDVAAQRIELRTTARVAGNLTCAVLKIYSSAILDGRCTMAGTSLDAGTSSGKPQVLAAKAPVVTSIEPLYQQATAVITKT